MDFNLNAPQLAELFRRRAAAYDPRPNPTYLANQRKEFPEIHFMTVVAEQGEGRYRLETPWGSFLERVGCVDHSLVGYLKPGMSVMVRYSVVSKDEPYIRNLGPVKTGQPSNP